MRVRFVLYATFSIFLVFGCSSAASALDCRAAQGRLELFLDKLPRTCRTNADCSAYYYRVSSCERPVVRRRSRLGGHTEKSLLRVQADVREACAAQLAKEPACAPIPARPLCRSHRCVDALTPSAGAPAGP